MGSEFILTSEAPDLVQLGEKTLSEFLLRKTEIQVEKDPASVFLIDGISGHELLYSEVEPLSRRLASALLKSGVGPGDIVVHMTTFQMQQIPLMLACWRVNAIIRAIYKEDDAATTAEKVGESEAKLLFCDEDSLPMVEAALATLCTTPPKIVVCGDHKAAMVKGHPTFQAWLETGDANAILPQVTPQQESGDVAVILPTSGTTGPSKGAMHSHASFMSTIRICSNFPYSRTKPNLMASKGTHVSGSAMPFSILIHGLVGIVLPKMGIEIIGDTVTKYKPGYVFAFPTFITALASRQSEWDLCSVESIFTGGVVVTPSMKDAMMKWPNVNNVYIGYGMTECVTVSGTFTTTEGQESCVALENTPAGSIGRLFSGAQLQVRDTISHLPLGAGEQGEFWIKSPSLFLGYFKNPESTKKAFLDGWYGTGDVGYVQKGTGFLFVMDRAKDIFKYFNNHISPTDLENVLLTHPDVVEAVVFPVVDEGGHVPRAIVSLNKTPPQDKEFKSKLEQSILHYANEKLADYKKLRGGLFITDELPKGKTGKASRDLTAQMFGKN